MRLRMICEWGDLNPNLMQQLAQFTPNRLIDYGYCEDHFPFIFVLNDQQQFYRGRDFTHHSEVMRGNNLLQLAYDKTSGAKGSEFDAIGPVAVGRVGYGIDGFMGQKIFGSEEPWFADTEIVSYYGTSDHEAVLACTKRLLGRKLIKPDAFVVYGDTVTTAAQGATEIKALSDREREQAILQVAYHTGSWPDGRRVTLAEKEEIKKKLGLGSGSRPTAKNSMQAAMQKAGLTVPGQKWWALTSEELKRS